MTTNCQRRLPFVPVIMIHILHTLIMVTDVVNKWFFYIDYRVVIPNFRLLVIRKLIIIIENIVIIILSLTLTSHLHCLVVIICYLAIFKTLTFLISLTFDEHWLIDVLCQVNGTLATPNLSNNSEINHYYWNFCHHHPLINYK